MKKKKKGSIMKRITLVLLASMFLVASLVLIQSDYSFGILYEDLTHDYMVDVTTATGKEIDFLIDTVEKLFNSKVSQNGGNKANLLTKDYLKGIVGDTKISGITSSYAYVADPQGIILYHPTEELIGQKAETEALSKVVKKSNKIEVKKTGFIEYDVSGVVKYASYYVGADNSFILVITADKDDVQSALFGVIKKSVSIGVVSALLALVFSYFVINKSLKPLLKLTQKVSRFSELTFVKDEDEEVLVKKNNEVGRMALAVVAFREKITEVLEVLKTQANTLTFSAKAMNDATNDCVMNAEYIEDAINCISEGAMSQASDTQQASENVLTLGEMIDETTKEVGALSEDVAQIKALGGKANAILEDLASGQQRTEEDVMNVCEQTEKTNQAVEQIGEVITLISNIASKTNLLSLNASIESARAGEAGKGFKVVADNIKSLAEQTMQSADSIGQIVRDMLQSSKETVDTANEVRNTIAVQKEKVSQTIAIFETILSDMEKAIFSIEEIFNHVVAMNDSKNNVVDIIQSLSAISEENASSTQECNASITQLGSLMDSIKENSNALKTVVEELESQMREFTIE